VVNPAARTNKTSPIYGERAPGWRSLTRKLRRKREAKAQANVAGFKLNHRLQANGECAYQVKAQAAVLLRVEAFWKAWTNIGDLDHYVSALSSSAADMDPPSLP